MILYVKLGNRNPMRAPEDYAENLAVALDF